MKHSFRTRAGRALNVLGLRPAARRIEAWIRPSSFRPDSDVTPRAVRRALHMAHKEGLADKGDYLEFGVYRGYALWSAQKTMDELGNGSMRFFGFDSFEGFPEVHGVDKYKGDFSRGQFAASLDSVRAMLTEHGIDWQRTRLVAGYYTDTLNDALKLQHELRTAAVVLLDCVLYESTKLVLPFLEGLLADGSILIFDDWNAFDADDNRGERRAFREFLAANPKWSAEEGFEYGIYGKAFKLRLVEPQ